MEKTAEGDEYLDFSDETQGAFLAKMAAFITMSDRLDSDGQRSD